MQKTKIEWVKNPDGTQGFSWNPIQGLCPVECWYCYGTEYYRRFWHKKGYPVRLDMDIFQKGVHEMARTRKRRGVFLCSVFELFHPITKTQVPKTKVIINWRDAIFEFIEKFPQHRFYILTKFPQNIDREMPENCWIGVTFTGDTDMYNAIKIKDIKAKIKFASFEPMLNFPGRGLLVSESLPFLEHINWIILGRLTGHGKKYAPKKSWIDTIVREAKKTNIPVFIKDNLKEIWGDKLIQEMPEG